MEKYIGILALITAVLLFWHISTKEPHLDFHGHFKPKRHFFFERCSKCGKRLKHYHWFWGKGDFMACDVDYDGNTSWFCKTCNDKLSKEAVPKCPGESYGA